MSFFCIFCTFLLKLIKMTKEGIVAMLELKTLKDILEADGKHSKKSSCRRLLKTVKRKLSETRKLLVNLSGVAVGFESGNAQRWLVENFSRLEETAKVDMMTLKHLQKLLGDGETPLFYRVFQYVLEKTARLEETDIKNILRVCNEHAGGISLEDSGSLLPLLRLCVCTQICEIFSELRNESHKADERSIEELFLTLDELSFFDENEVYKSSDVEKIFYSDPAGIYARLSSDTKAVYRKNLIKLSKKKKITEKKLAEIIVAKCRNNEGNDRHIGKYLVDRACGGKTYVFLVFFLTFIFTLLLCLISPVFLVSVFSVYGCSRLLVDKFFVRFFVKDFHLPRVELSEIPKGFGVMTVITSLLTGGESDGELFDKLEKMYHSNGGKNVYFGLLLDLCDSDEKYSTKDAEIINLAKEKILFLRKKYGGFFFLFIREREYNEGEEKYIAPERKRGAVNSLSKFLCGKGDDFCFGSIKPDEEICENIKYVFTLDADTNLAFDSLRTMTGIMLHPQNRPIIDKEKNAVTKGYGILQPAMNPTLTSANKSFFSSVMCGHGGVDLYSSGGSDTLMSMFGRSIFCGKGMFDKDCFYELLCTETAFPENSVLSHDAPEGARLRCAYVPQVIFTDSFPSEELSFYKRQHRWIRGDVQNVPFLLPYVATKESGKIRNGIGCASKFFIWQNMYSALLPVFTLVTLFASAVCDDGTSALLASAALSVYILPFGYSVFMGAKRALWHNFRRSFYSDRVYTGIWTSFFRMLFRLCAIPKSAAVSLDAVARSVYRSLVSRKKMLEWTTAAQNDAEKRDGLLGYIRKNLVNALCGTLLFVLSPSGLIKLLSLMWLFMPVFSYHSGKLQKRRKRHITEPDKNTLVGYCSDMWKFFSENVSENTNNLPTDNVSLYPERKLSRMTSPTNIGLYLVSCLCAYKLGLADEKEMCRRILSCLESVDALEKYNGLLYNWYDVFKAQPMTPMYISSVDLGNFVACLVCVKEGIAELCRQGKDREKIQSLCEKLIKQTDLSLLFDKTRKLFYIGATVSDGKLIFDRNRYDMLMSEARILSFCAVAQHLVPSEHMKHLSRRFVKGKGYMGLASWSGTAFEFFMPEIFMPSKEGSLVYEALCFAYTNIRNKGAGHGEQYVYGISESCYNEFDSASNYKYHAFGIPEIAVNVFEKQNVISPYSSFLCLKMSKKSVMKNLERLQRLGAYGEYGFYESVDFERTYGKEGFSVVKCFMLHHVGMSIASCTNFLCDSIVSDWFYNDEKMNSARELTEEKIPYDAYVAKNARQHYIRKLPLPETVPDSELCEMSPAKLHSSTLEILAKRGKLSVKNENLLLSRKNCFPHGLSDFEAAITIDEDEFFFDKKCRLSCDAGLLVMSQTFVSHSADKYEAALYVTAGNNTCDTLRMRIRLRQLSGKRDKKITFSLSFYPLLDTKQNSEVCSFFDMSDFVLEESENEVYFRRFSTNMCFCCASVEGKNKRALLDGEKITLTCDAERIEGVMSGEFAFSLSDSRKCAEVGLVRCREDSFGEVAQKLRECKTARLSEHRGRKSAVLGCSVQKEKITPVFPLDSKSGSFHLLSTEKFSCLVGENSLGVSFERDINHGRVTHFSGLGEIGTGGESLYLDDGFDLCKNSSETIFADNSVLFKGEYNGFVYSVKVCVSASEPCKLITVNGLYGENVNFRLSPSSECDGERSIGAGLVFFGKRGADLSGFAFGFCKGEEVIRGAECHLCEDVQISVSTGSGGECVFCIGKAEKESAKEIYDKIRADCLKNLENSRQFSGRIKLREPFPDENLKKVLEKYFVFPSDSSCKRVFVKTREELFLFDCLMLMFSEFPDKKEYLIKAFDRNAVSILSKSLLCLILCEYVRISKNGSVCELKIRGETLYKRCLSYLCDTPETQAENDIFLLSLERFSSLCDDCKDTRTALFLKSKMQKITENGRDGIFL